MTEGDAVKAEISGAVGFTEAGELPLDPLPLQADITKTKRARIKGRKEL
jgi:hypothetical protein